MTPLSSGSASAFLGSSFFSSFLVVRIPRRLHPSLKTVTPLHPTFHAYMYRSYTSASGKSSGRLTVELMDASMCICQVPCMLSLCS